MTWTEPYFNSDTITQYKIEAQLPTSDWLEVCDGTDATIIEHAGCVVSMDTFWEPTTFNKDYNDLVQFRVTAYNVNGWGLSSDANTDGAVVLTVPRFMHPAQRDTRTSDQTIYVFWDPLTTSEQMGGSAVLSYGLQWDDNTGMASWSNL